jgi:hypothetical protein
MRVNKAGKQRRVAEVDDFCTCRDGRAGSHAGDFSVGHNDETGLGQRVALPVEHPHGFQHIRFARWLLRLPECRCGERRTRSQKAQNGTSQKSAHHWLLPSTPQQQAERRQ